MKKGLAKNHRKARRGQSGVALIFYAETSAPFLPRQPREAKPST